jgi:hypothetical protein
VEWRDFRVEERSEYNNVCTITKQRKTKIIQVNLFGYEIFKWEILVLVYEDPILNHVYINTDAYIKCI